MSPMLGIFLLISVAIAGTTNNAQQCETNAQCPSTHCCLLGSFLFLSDLSEILRESDLRRRITYCNSDDLQVTSIAYEVNKF